MLKLMALLLSCCVWCDCWYVYPSVDQRQAPAAHLEIWAGGRVDDGGDVGCWGFAADAPVVGVGVGTGDCNLGHGGAEVDDPTLVLLCRVRLLVCLPKWGPEASPGCTH